LREKLLEIFSQCQQDAAGAISIQDMQILLEDLGFAQDEERSKLTEAFQTLDDDHDDRITFDQFERSVYEVLNLGPMLSLDDLEEESLNHSLGTAHQGDGIFFTPHPHRHDDQGDESETFGSDSVRTQFMTPFGAPHASPPLDGANDGSCLLCYFSLNMKKW
jgi:hypothetical protein